MNMPPPNLCALTVMRSSLEVKLDTRRFLPSAMLVTDTCSRPRASVCACWGRTESMPLLHMHARTQKWGDTEMGGQAPHAPVSSSGQDMRAVTPT